MGEIKLYRMKAAFDEIMATAIKRQHEPQPQPQPQPQRIVGETTCLLTKLRGDAVLVPAIRHGLFPAAQIAQVRLKNSGKRPIDVDSG